MTVTFPDIAALAVDVLAARPGAAPDTEAEAIEVALQPDGEDPLVLSLSLSAAYHLREVIDAALEAPFWWEADPSDETIVLGLAMQAVESVLDAEVVDLARHRSVRWDETWASTHPR